MDKTNQISSNPADPIVVNPEFGRLEYNALCEEILKRTEIQYNLLNWTLLLAGAFLAAGIQPTVVASVLFIYPILALWMAAYWKYNQTAIMEMDVYISKRIEEPLKVEGFHRYMHKEYSDRPVFGSLGVASLAGLIVGTQISAILIAFMRGMPITTVDWLLLIMSFTATVLTGIVLYYIWKVSKARK